MIKWYRFKNLYSFKGEQLVDLTLKANSSESSFDRQWMDCRITKVLAVMGANGSGKSNLIKPLAFLSWFCSKSFKSMDNSDSLPIYSHICNKSEPSEIEICFVDSKEAENSVDHIEFKYFLKFNRERVLHEELKYKSSRLFSSVFYRKYDTETNTYKVKSAGNDFPVNELKTVPQNSSAISYFRRKGDNIIADAMHYIFYSIENNLNVFGKSSFNYGKVLEATEFYNEEPDIFEKAKKYLSRMDFGLNDIRIKTEDIIDKKTGETEQRVLPYGIHTHDGNEFEIPFIMESTGTQSCYYFIYKLISALNYGGVAVIDELDSDLHPYMIRELLDMFANEGINKLSSQLIFSCHTAEVLKTLNKHNVYLVEKSDSVSEAWRLDEIQGLRSQDNLYTKYITGALGGVPDINI
ncbi:AAA family ATPase [Dickeya chrysanthemi]|uniref:AAA family ATPase n=1 Tax=Dickeya chrysanthemi TaxID=556 RepID=UPI00039BCAFF|nr:ATP-binding protein [Dickeya chrysanthemi]